MGSRFKRPKMGNVKRQADGITFDSDKEYRRYADLRLMERVGEISDLQVHPRFRLCVEGSVVCQFWPDFIYVRGGEVVVEDVKGRTGGGVQWQHFRLKAKLFEAITGIAVEVV